MKPIFGIDITEDKDNIKMNADEFTGAAASDERSDALESCSKAAENTIDSAKLPPVLRVLRAITGIAGGVCILAFLSSFSDLGFIDAYKKSPLIFYIGIIGIAVFVLLSVLANRREHSVIESDETKAVISSINSVKENIYAELSVPENAASVDILVFRYKMKDGEAVPKALPLALTAYINYECKIFIKDDMLCLADLEKRYEFPLCDIGEIRRVDKKISIPQWNKSTPYNSKKYRDYNLVKNNMDCISFKPFYILEIRHGDELFGIYFPSYELPVFEELLNISGEKSKE